MEFKRRMNLREEISGIAFVLFFQFVISGGTSPYDFLTSQSSCTSTWDCPPNKNLICLQIYEGCHMGHCACHPHNSTIDRNGNCVPLLRGGDLCGEGWGECRSPMECAGGSCRCPRGQPLSSDRKHCLEHGAKLVGERCSLDNRGRHHKHKCFRETHNGFTQNDVKCSLTSKTCVCNEGFKTLGNRCLTRRLNERGCRTSIHCEGGAVCSGSRCVCPTGYFPDDNFHKCLRSDAEKNVELGGSCDEVNENRYCAPGLVCYRCAGEQHDKCIRFLLTTKYGTSGAHLLNVNIAIIVVVVFIFTITMQSLNR